MSWHWFGPVGGPCGPRPRPPPGAAAPAPAAAGAPAGGAPAAAAPAGGAPAAPAAPGAAAAPGAPPRPLTASRSGLLGATGSLLKMRGELTIAAVCGALSGTLITSRRKRAVFGSSGAAVLAARQLVGRAHARRARHVDEDVVVVARLRDDGVGVRAAAGLHARHQLGAGDVRDVEDADAAHAILADRIRHAAEAAVANGWSPIPTT